MMDNSQEQTEQITQVPAKKETRGRKPGTKFSGGYKKKEQKEQKEPESVPELTI